MVRAGCEIQLNDSKRCVDFMQMLDLNEVID